MAHVVCVMKVEEKRVTFTWSEGPAAFAPYTLEGMDYTQFKRMAEAARGKLADLVKDFLYAEENIPQATFELAKAGYQLHESLFCHGNDVVPQVRKWLEKLSQSHAVDTVEIVVDSPWSLPWNLIYDQKPTKEEFLGAKVSPDRWEPFWGLKYNMCGGGGVNPLRRMPILRDPHVLVVVDPQIRDGLPEEQRQRLAAFIESHNLKPVHTKDELEEAIASQRPDVLYWLSHASPEALVLSDEPVSPQDLLQLLRREASDDVRFGGLAFLNSCQTAEVAGEEGSFFEAFHKAGFAGMIGTEHQTIDQFANPLGLDFLEAFLDKGESVGSAMRRLRGRVPLGLLYGTYCPPDIRVERGDPGDGVEIHQLTHVAGVALGVAAQPEQLVKQLASKPVPPLPDEPYPSLAFYERKDRALFAGRDDDIERFATYLDDASTRILVLHGESGVGKSSFLHAGVIPYLEEECVGYRFIHDRQADVSAITQGSVIFIRATNDLFGQLAQALCKFCARPYEYQTPLGETVSADLPGVLTEFVGATVNHATVRGLLRADPAALGQLLAAISSRLPFTAILVIDQGEEVFTLARTAEDQQCGRRALDMLRQTVGTSGDFKLIFALRTEYYGRVIDRLRRGLHDTGGIREYLLTDFDEQSLVEAIRRPTSAERIPYAAEVPYEKYCFSYSQGVAEEVANRVVRYTAQRRDSVLPLMQVICSQLYRLAKRRPDKTITLADLKALGGIEGGMRNHVDGLLGQLLKDQPVEKQPVQKLFTHLHLRQADGTLGQLLKVRRLDEQPVQKLFTHLYLKQADGTLTTALLAEDEVRNRWTGRMPFDELLTSCNKLRLLKVNSLRIGMDEERRYVSLGHDALAKIAAEWDEQLGRAARTRKWFRAVAGISAVALVMVVISAFAVMSSIRATKAQNEAEQALAKGVLRSLEFDPIDDYGKDGIPELNPGELTALWELATTENESVRLNFVRIALNDQDLARRMGKRPAVAIQSAVGLNDDRWVKIEAMISQELAAGNVKSAGLDLCLQICQEMDVDRKLVLAILRAVIEERFQTTDMGSMVRGDLTAAVSQLDQEDVSLLADLNLELAQRWNKSKLSEIGGSNEAFWFEDGYLFFLKARLEELHAVDALTSIDNKLADIQKTLGIKNDRALPDNIDGDPGGFRQLNPGPKAAPIDDEFCLLAADVAAGDKESFELHLSKFDQVRAKNLVTQILTELKNALLMQTRYVLVRILTRLSETAGDKTALSLALEQYMSDLGSSPWDDNDLVFVIRTFQLLRDQEPGEDRQKYEKRFEEFLTANCPENQKSLALALLPISNAMTEEEAFVACETILTLSEVQPNFAVITPILPESSVGFNDGDMAPNPEFSSEVRLRAGTTSHTHAEINSIDWKSFASLSNNAPQELLSQVDSLVMPWFDRNTYRSKILAEMFSVAANRLATHGLPRNVSEIEAKLTTNPAMVLVRRLVGTSRFDSDRSLTPYRLQGGMFDPAFEVLSRRTSNAEKNQILDSIVEQMSSLDHAESASAAPTPQNMEPIWNRLRQLPPMMEGESQHLISSEWGESISDSVVLNHGIAVRYLATSLNNSQSKTLEDIAFFRLMDETDAYSNPADARGYSIVISTLARHEKLPPEKLKEYAMRLADAVGRASNSHDQISMIGAFDALLPLLQEEELIAYLRWPNCVEFLRYVVLDDFKRRYREELKRDNLEFSDSRAFIRWLKVQQGRKQHLREAWSEPLVRPVLAPLVEPERPKSDDQPDDGDSATPGVPEATARSWTTPQRGVKNIPGSRPKGTMLSGTTRYHNQLKRLIVAGTSPKATIPFPPIEL